MAIIKKNGNLCGAIGNIVFVNDGDRVFARMKPDSIKQSARTKAAASVFGLVSTREKLLRLNIFKALSIPAIQYFAARHRARIQKTITKQVTEDSANMPEFGDPQALVGFNFNPKLDWQNCTNFFPEYSLTPGSGMKVSLPQLAWGKQVTPPKNAASCTLTLVTLHADLNSRDVPVTQIARFDVEINASSASPAQDWIFPLEETGDWLLIIGCLKFSTHKTGAGIQPQFAATYLWAGLG